MGLSTSKIIPETKFDTIVCRPKPIPTLRAPATIAILDKLNPIEDKATQLPMCNQYTQHQTLTYFDFLYPFLFWVNSTYNSNDRCCKVT